MHIAYDMKTETIGLFREEEGTSRRMRRQGRAGGGKYEQNTMINMSENMTIKPTNLYMNK